METNKKLNRYDLKDQVVITGFSNFNEAENYVQKEGGELVEIAFKDGNDNPQITNEAGIIEKKTSLFCRSRS